MIVTVAQCLIRAKYGDLWASVEGIPAKDITTSSFFAAIDRAVNHSSTRGA
jgi:hypothetical protein